MYFVRVGPLEVSMQNDNMNCAPILPSEKNSANLIRICDFLKMFSHLSLFTDMPIFFRNTCWL